MLTIVDLVRISLVCKEWQSSIRTFRGATWATLVANVEAPDSLPDESLTELQLAFRRLKRVLLLQDGLTGAHIDRDGVLRWGRCPSRVRWHCKYPVIWTVAKEINCRIRGKHGKPGIFNYCFFQYLKECKPQLSLGSF